MKNKVFNRGLYLDALRRTSVLGGLFTVLLTVAALIVFFAATLFLPDITDIQWTPDVIDLIDMHPFLFTIPFFLVPLLCLNLFGFLNKRATSDFWHSVPFTRVCLFNTFSAAILTWAVAALVISGGISLICFASMPKYFAINWVPVLFMSISIVVMSLLSMSGVLTAMSITGTYFSNVVVSCIILFLPRILLLFFSYASTNDTLFHASLDSSILSPAFNLIAGFFLAFEDIPDMVLSYKSIIYTAVLGLIYYGVGGVLFCIRKSEAAANSAVNRYMQAAFRIIVCMTVCLVPIYLITSDMNNPNSHNSSSDNFSIFVLYVVALIAYFIYELITTKKLKNLLKAIPSLGFVVLFNFLIIGGSHVAYRIEYGYTPSPENVTSIRFYDETSQSADYFGTALTNISISDNDIEQILCSAYARTRTRYELSELTYEGHQTITVGFTTGGKTRYRNIWIENDNLEQLNDLLYLNKDYREIFDAESIFNKALSTGISLSMPYSAENNQGININLDKIKEAYIKDVNAMGFSRWFDLVSRQNYNIFTYEDDGETKHAKIIGHINGFVTFGSKKTSFEMPICNLTPTAYDLLMKDFFEYQTNWDQQKELIDIAKGFDITAENMDLKYNEINVELYNGITRAPEENYFIDSPEKLQKLIPILESSVGKIPTSNSRIAEIWLHKAKVVDKDKDIINLESYTSVFYIPEDADLTFLLGNNNLK